jgi:very-short-patch-repair endonuclease
MPIRRLASGGFLRELAREMRADPTPSERRAWNLLRNRRCLGLKFRRQHVVAGYIVDFYCAELRLAVEIDGAVHDDEHQRWKDEFRTATLEGLGIRVVRVANDELSSNRILELLRPLVTRTTFPLSVSRRGGQGVRPTEAE